MYRTLLSAVAATIILGACGSRDSVPEAPQKRESKRARPLKEADPVAYYNSVNSVASDVSPSQSAEFQKLFLCELKKNNARPDPRPVTAEFIRAIEARVKANPSAASQCAAS